MSGKIEKLYDGDYQEWDENNSIDLSNMRVSELNYLLAEMYDKINEIVDVVNQLKEESSDGDS